MASKHSLQIKEVRTFLIEGVGSGGDYHNVSSSVLKIGGSILSNIGQWRALAHR